MATVTAEDAEAEARKLMATHAATPARGWDSIRARADLREMWDATYDAWLEACGATCFDEVEQ